MTSLPRPGPNDTQDEPGFELDLVLDQYADLIETLEAQNLRATKRVTHSLVGPGNQSRTLTSTEQYNSRLISAIPVTPTRFRLRIRNWDTLASSPGDSTFAILSYLARPAQPTSSPYRYDGAFAASATPILFSGVASASVVAGAELVSDWFTNAGTNAIVAGKLFVISTQFQFVAASGSGTIYGDPIGGIGRRAATSSASATAAIVATESDVYGDVRIEYEYVTNLRPDGTPEVMVGLVVGDSIGVGQCPSEQGAAGILGTHQTWPGRAAIANKFCVVNASVGQSRLTNTAGVGWGNSDNVDEFLARFDIATSVPDFAIIALGTNDATNGTGIEGAGGDLQASFGDVCTQLRNRGIGRIYAATIPPAGFGGPLSITATTTNGSKDITAISGSTDARTVHMNMLVTGAGIPPGAVIQAIDDHAGFSISVAASASAAGVTLTLGDDAWINTAANESIRNRTNQWLRTLPFGINGIFDFANVMEVPMRPGLCDSRFMSFYPHPMAEGYEAMAAAVRL